MTSGIGMTSLATALVILGTTTAFAQPGRPGGRGGFPSFEEADTNGDGKITESEFQGPARFFERVDANGDGSLTKEEMESMRDRGNRPGGGPGEGFDPGQFEERMLERHQEVLGASDEEWTAIKPLVKAVIDARRDGGRSGGPGGPGGFGARGGRDEMRSTEETALRSTLDSESASSESIKSRLEALRSARASKEAELKTARDNLRDVLTPRQEAELVLMGTLD